MNHKQIFYRKNQISCEISSLFGKAKRECNINKVFIFMSSSYANEPFNLCYILYGSMFPHLRSLTSFLFVKWTRTVSLKSLLHFCQYKASYFLTTDLRLFSCLELIDQVLEQDDLDKDGYLSYIEYVLGRKKDEHKTQPKYNKP